MLPALVTAGLLSREAGGAAGGNVHKLTGYWDGVVLMVALVRCEEEGEREGEGKEGWPAVQRGPQASSVGGQWGPAAPGTGGSGRDSGVAIQQ